MKIALVSFGCKLNRSETDSMINQLPAYGAEYVSDIALADAVILNTCAVTKKAQTNGEQFIAALKKKHPRLIVAVTGCLAELMKDGLKAYGADIITTNECKEDTLRRLINTKPLPDLSHEHCITKTHTRAFLKVQDGCDAFCSYCIIPTLRGKPRSIPLNNILDEANRLIAHDYREIVITGIHVGLYDKKEGGLTGLLKAISSLEGNFRLRLTSLNIGEVTPELIEIISSSNGKICPHFHLSLQSGSAEILRLMNRRYLPEDFIYAVSAIRNAIPDAGIGADLIVGFPGESDYLFEETIETLKKSAPDYLHVFPYSRRPGTPAAQAVNQLSETVKNERARLIRNLAMEMKIKAAGKLIGKKATVLTENNNRGHTGSYWLVHLPENTQSNIFAEVTVTGIRKDGSLQG